MSELINNPGQGKHVLWHLLTTASALALMGAVGVASNAEAAQDDHPTVWIELGGALQRLDTGEEKYAPPFLFETPRPNGQTVDPLSVGHLPRSAFEADGKIVFQPDDSSWNFTAAARFGRTRAHQFLHQQAHYTGPIFMAGTGPVYQQVFQFVDSAKSSSESHAVLDFQVGKDVGFGLFGTGGTSSLNFGVRFAQFNSRSSTTFQSDPDARHYTNKFVIFTGFTITLLTKAVYHTHKAAALASRSFQGLGPTLSWNSSEPLVGSARDGEVVFDWGVNAALLFGRQKADVHHQSTSRYAQLNYGQGLTTSYPDRSPDKHRSRSVTVPNIGAFAGLTYRIDNARISAGYRADFFFGATDGGLDHRRTEDQKFYGPFATVSIGLGG